MLQHLLLRVPFHDQAKELTLADLAREKPQAGVKIQVPVEPGCVGVAVSKKSNACKTSMAYRNAD